MNKQDQLWEQQDKLIGEIDFILRAFQEETPIYNIVTDDYPAIEGFIGNSVLETSEGNAGYIMHGEDNEIVFAQFFSDDKKIHTYMKDGKIISQQFLVLDPEMKGSANILNCLAKKVDELRAIQTELDELEEEATK
ncbi:hypothetical protein [Enterococcus sp. DIV1420a]|uniref:hypothetical protein n=1 Tax=Enterococcus sp. DIV1420a TaxID=2774672 RepID=UPI003F2401E5